MPQDCNTQREAFWLAGITSIRSWLTANQRRDRSPHHCRNVLFGNWNCQQKLLGHRGVRGGSRSAAFTPAEEAPAAPWSPAPLPLPPARSLARRALSSSCKLSGSAVDKKPGRPSANLPRAGWGELKGTGRVSRPRGQDREGSGLRGPASARGGKRGCGSGNPCKDPETGKSARAKVSAPSPGSHKVATTKRRGGGIGGRGWDGDTIAGARFGVTTVYLVLFSQGAGAAREWGGCRQRFRSKHLGGGHATLFLGAELPSARVCHCQSPGTKAELTTGGEGGSSRAKKEKESKFPSATLSEKEGGGRRGRGEAEAANDRDPAATGKLLGSRRRRHRRGPHSKRTPPRLAGSRESSRRDRNRAQGAREEGCAQARDGEPSAARTGPEGQGDTRASQDKSGLGKSPRSPSFRGG